MGAAAFSHKGGLHVSAVQKDPKTYEHINPEEVGNTRNIVVSDQSGKSNIISRLKSIKINLFPTGLENISLNKLKFVSGIEIQSNHPDFGGLSGLIINEDKSLIAVGDQGIWLTGKIKINENGKLVEIINGRLGHLKGNENNPLYKLGKSYTDAESIEPYNDKFVVSFERKHRILIFKNYM